MDAFARLWRRHLIGNAPVEITVFTLGGASCQLAATRDWTVADLKDAVAKAMEVATHEQRLFVLAAELQDAELVSAVFAEGVERRVYLVRRPPLQAHWLMTVKTTPKQLQHAPLDVRNDREVVLAAVAADRSVMRFAGPEVWSDRGFVQEAMQFNWHDLANASQELRADRSLVLPLVSLYGRALKYVSPKLYSDREVILAALGDCIIPRGFPPGTFQSILAEHAAFVFRLADPDLRLDREFMIAAVSKCAEASTFAPANMWSDRGFVLAAVSKSGILLERASDDLRADLAVSLAAVRQNAEAMKFVAGTLDNDPDLVLATMVREPDALTGLTSEDLHIDVLAPLTDWLLKLWAAFVELLCRLFKQLGEIT